MSDDSRKQIVEWLASRNHSADEIEQIMARLDQYEAEVVRASIFDSVDTGQFDIEAIIRDALETDDQSDAADGSD